MSSPKRVTDSKRKSTEAGMLPTPTSCKATLEPPKTFGAK